MADHERVSVATLPNEILLAILSHLGPRDLAHAKAVSQQFYQAACEQVLWKEHCLNDFNYWNPKHVFARKLSPTFKIGNGRDSRSRTAHDGTRLSSGDLDWYSVLKKRILVEREVAGLLDSIISSQIGRIQRYERIVQIGFDAKDYLLSQSRVSPDETDGLARRYYAKVALQLLQRGQTIDLWAEAIEADVPIEKAVACFDSFGLVGDNDLEMIEQRFNAIATDFVRLHPNFQQQTTRQLAFSLCQYLRERNLVGLHDEDDYQKLENSFIGLAISRNEVAASLPLVSCTIFSGVARRVGLDAMPISYPWHVYTVVSPPEGLTLDGERATSVSSTQMEEKTRMFLDPWRGIDEVPVSDLRGQLLRLGVNGDEADRRLMPLSTRDAVHRCSQNILRAVSFLHTRDERVHPNAYNVHPFSEQALYAAMWVEALYVPFVRSLDNLVHFVQYNYPMDIIILRQHWPAHARPFQLMQFEDLCHVIRATDQTPKKVSRRVSGEGGIIYKIGQVFKHRSYGFLGIISGWDRVSEPDHHHQRHQQSAAGGGQADDQPQPQCPGLIKQKTFYHVLVEDQSMRYIAENNINAIYPEDSAAVERLFDIAGKHFKRWDKEKRMFVSNIRDEYPDD